MNFEIGTLLYDTQWKVVLAESCTGGLLSSIITDVPGSSAYYVGGVSTYAYEAKKKLLGVKSETLEAYGAVSRQTVMEMSLGVRHLFSGEVPFENIIGISISGIAGPGGGMPGKPVGLVWFSLSAKTGHWAWKRIWKGNRIENKEYSAQFALEIIKAFVMNQLPTEDF
ncbi:MAG: competence protein ComA [Chloroflexi bacterium HGW-Chloroflexi-10]|nr:MAG: competence protein ComA [Chloroflexi bacterium HGW-Chloroflexi-10]